jgi:septal ring factor EnvC (AmiA/AmiB activator)
LDLGVGSVHSLCNIGNLVFVGGWNNFKNIRVINSVDQQIFDEVILPAVRNVQSLQICPVSKSQVYLTVSGEGKSYTEEKTDIFDISSIYEQSMMEKIFKKPNDQNQEIEKQLTKYGILLSEIQSEENSKLLKSLRNKINELENQIILKDKKINKIKMKMSSLKKDLKKCRTEKSQYANQNNQLKNQLSKITKEYNLIRAKFKYKSIIKKSLLINSLSSTFQFDKLNSNIEESYLDYSESFIGSQRHLSIIKLDLQDQNKELIDNVKILRAENYSLYLQNQTLKAGMKIIKYW